MKLHTTDLLPFLGGVLKSPSSACLIRFSLPNKKRIHLISFDHESLFRVLKLFRRGVGEMGRGSRDMGVSALITV